MVVSTGMGHPQGAEGAKGHLAQPEGTKGSGNWRLHCGQESARRKDGLVRGPMSCGPRLVV